MKKRVARAAAAFAIAFTLPSAATAAFGDPDCSFGANGVQPLPQAFGRAFTATESPSGSLLVRSGYMSTGSQVFRMGASGENPTLVGGCGSGVVEDTFDMLRADGHSLFVTANGGGSACGAGVAALLPQGGFDTAFGSNGFATAAGLTEARAGPEAYPTDRVIIGGKANGSAALARFNFDGSPDPTFGTNGVATNPSAGAYYVSIAVQRDGSILALGVNTLTRHLADGRLDASFGSGGMISIASIIPFGHEIRLQPTGKILVSGQSPTGSVRIARYTTSGTLDVSAAGGAGYRDAGGVIVSPMRLLQLAPDGRPLVTAAASLNGTAGTLIRYGVDLQDDTSLQLPYLPTFATVLASGRLIVGDGSASGQVRRLLGDTDAPTCGGPALPQMSIDDPLIAEGGPGVITLMPFTVTLSFPPAATVTVDYQAVGGGLGTAQPYIDYIPQSGRLTLAPGQTRAWIMVPIIGNDTPQPGRPLELSLSNAVGAQLVKSQSNAGIVDDDPTPAATPVAQLRLYNDFTKEHLYTTDTNEYATLPSRGWSQEGIGYTMFSNAGTYSGVYTVPLYRFYQAASMQHHWTTDWNEAMVLAASGSWGYEGISGYVLPSPAGNSTPLFRLSYAIPALHLWTLDANEKDVLSTQRGWTYEGVVGHVLPP
jgi:uncharacterized delta-60 repeat protein